MSKSKLQEIRGISPNFKGVEPEAEFNPRLTKPIKRSELLASLLADPECAVRVEPDARQLVLLDEFRDRVSHDGNGAELFHLPLENKFAVMLKCTCGDIHRVVRTSDLHQVTLCLAEAEAARREARRDSRARRREALRVPRIPITTPTEN